jgi:catechol 2,3-dioxygenase-like lactoylglutathione lyase family enzyme
MVFKMEAGHMISHFDHIVLTVANIDRAVSFYETVLHMEAITFDDGRKAVRFGQQKINLQLLGEELRNHAMEGSGDLCLITNWTMAELMAHLKDCDVPILEGPVTKTGAQGPIESVYFNDPDNNLIEVSVYANSTPNEQIETSSNITNSESISSEITEK